ncbi:MAG TPA: S8 family serine peptidase [Mycobacteriales bacterium]|nr:S8 family serine peptidase [Mycobacteriales bacterium]
MISRRLSVLTSALLVTLAGALAAPTGPAPKPAEAATGRAAADPDTLLVRFRPGVAPRRAHTVLARDGATVLGPPSRTGYVAVRAPGRAEALRRRLAADPAVATVEPNYRRRALAKPDDPRFKRQRRYLSLLRLPEAWDIGRGSPTIDIAVVDTGVDLDTPDLAGRIAPGYNAWTGGRTPPQDDNGHGTVVAGAAAATTDNHVGIAGAAWTARIIPVKALDASGWGDDVHVSAGIQWAVDHGAEIINLSLGDPSPSAALHAAVQYARSHGVLVVAAAGNSGVEAAYYPAAYPEVLAVGATDEHGDVADFSTRGAWIDVVAPGRRIVSTTLDTDAPYAEAYDTRSGTSFAAPLASGIATLVRARYPSWTADQIINRLRATAQDAGAPGPDPEFGTGILDAAAALGAPRASSLSANSLAPALTGRGRAPGS